MNAGRRALEARYLEETKRLWKGADNAFYETSKRDYVCR